MEDDHELTKAGDEVIISRYLKRMIVHGDSWPELFKEDADVFNKNPNTEFLSEIPAFVIVKPRTESCGTTDGCETGCWRITGREKPIRSMETGKLLGFKKILKFCKNRFTVYNRKWVMEEYRLAPRNLNWKQDHVICKIRLLFASEISSLLLKHFNTASEPLPKHQLLPAYGFCKPSDAIQDESYFLLTISVSEEKEWPRGCVTNVYGIHPLMLVEVEDMMFRHYGACFFADLTETCGKSVMCGDGYWKIQERDSFVSDYGTVIGLKNVFKFYEKRAVRFFSDQGEEVKVTWTIDEYRLNEMVVTTKKVLCVLRVDGKNVVRKSSLPTKLQGN